MIRVVVADDHGILREGLTLLINGQPDMSVVGEAADGLEAEARVADLQPDVLILDLHMPSRSGLESLEPIQRVSPQTRILVLTMQESAGTLRSVIASGAAGYVLKKAAHSELLTAIRMVHGGRPYIGVAVGEGLFQQALGEPAAATSTEAAYARLSDREREVLKYVARGYTSKEIAQRIGLSPKTVDTHRERVMKKLGLRERSEIVRFAASHGLLDPKDSFAPKA